MSGWRLQPEVIRGVLDEAEAQLETMNEAWSQDRLDAVIEEMDAVGPAGADVLTAVVEVLNGQGGRLSSMGNRASAGLIGVDAATACFESGQVEMVDQVQAQMVASAGSGEFSWWYSSTVPEGAA